MQELRIDQKKAFAVAAAVTATAVAAVVAIGVNFGLFGVAAAGGKTGRLTPTSAAAQPAGSAEPAGAVEQPPVVETIVVDAPAGGGNAPGAAQLSAPGAMTAGPGAWDDDSLLLVPEGTTTSTTVAPGEHEQEDEHLEYEHPEYEQPEQPEDPSHDFDD